MLDAGSVQTESDKDIVMGDGGPAKAGSPEFDSRLAKFQAELDDVRRREAELKKELAAQHARVAAWQCVPLRPAWGRPAQRPCQGLRPAG